MPPWAGEVLPASPAHTVIDPAQLLGAAVTNNVRWCAEVCGTDPASRTPGIWVAAAPPHPWFPDLVTRRPGLAAGVVADALGGRAGCSVKDSYADVDLRPWGFTVLVEARWIGAAPAAAMGTSPLSPLMTPSALCAWCAAAGLPECLPGGLLSSSVTTVLVDGTAGAVATRSAGVVGVSNVVGSPTVDVWSALRTTLGARHPGLPVVGYEHGVDLQAALAAGFTDLGPLRIWARPETRPEATAHDGRT